MTVMNTKDLTTTPTWQDIPWELNERAVLYRNGDARLVVSRVWDDFPLWRDNQGQVPFYSPGDRRSFPLMANERFFPDMSELEHAYYELGDWELVARWLRIFHGALIAEVDTISTGYSQGDYRTVLTIVTQEWLDHVGAMLIFVREEVATSSHLKEFAAWCNGDYMQAEIEVANPHPGKYEIAMSEDERDDADGSYWTLADNWIDAMDGPMHDNEDVDKWLRVACDVVDTESRIAQRIREDVRNAGHWVI